jgi:hypothetical protein
MKLKQNIARREIIIGFVGISGIDDHHCLNFFS